MKWIRARTTLAALYGVAAVLYVHAASAQSPTSRFVGTWQLNVQQSKPAPGETAPASLVTTIERVDALHVRWSTTITDAQGQKDIETFDTPANGEFYSLNGTTMVSHRIGAATLQSTFKDVGGQTDQVNCTLSANALQMTCAGVITHADGSTVQYTDVFDRR
jgi:hypothetical protein